MAARIARTSIARCVQIKSRKWGISQSFSTSQPLLIRGTNQRTMHNLDLEEDAAADDDFFGVTSEHGVVTVPDSASFTRDRLEKFEHLTRSRKARVSDVKIIATGFGTIRYDSDNQPRYHGQYEDDTLLDDVHLDGFISDRSSRRASEPKSGVREPEARADKDPDASGTVSTYSESRGPKGRRILEQTQNIGSKKEPASRATYDDQNKDETEPVKQPELTAAQIEPRQKRQPKRTGRDVQQLTMAEQCTTESSQTSLDEEHYSVLESHCDVEETGKHEISFEPQKVQINQTHQRQRPDKSSPVATPLLRNETVNHSSGTAAVKPRTIAREEGSPNKLLKAQQSITGRNAKVTRDDESHLKTDFELLDTKTPSTYVHNIQKLTKRDRLEQTITKHPGGRNRFGGTAHEQYEEADDSLPLDLEEQQTAYAYLHRESPPSSVKLDSKGFRILKSEVRPDLSCLLHPEAVDLLRKRILYNDNDILVLNKPYGMLCHGPAPGVSDACILTKLLPDLSSALYPRQDTKLYTVHRLDRDVTGVLLLARTQRMADTLNSLFLKHQVSKTYLAITFGVPDHIEGVIDMPLAEGEVDGARRMVLSPKLDPEFQRLVPKFRKSFPAVTRYRVLASHGRAGYLELRPTTGVKHQLRAHLGLGLRCPILGDHKYSHLRRLAPQKLSGDMLDRLGIRQSKVRDAPLHLHARAVVVPEILDGKNLTVAADVPYHFAKNLRRLKLSRN
ncbi:unnamed protein product [Ixodes hexagonus]